MTKKLDFPILLEVMLYYNLFVTFSLLTIFMTTSLTYSILHYSTIYYIIPNTFVIILYSILIIKSYYKVYEEKEQEKLIMKNNLLHRKIKKFVKKLRKNRVNTRNIQVNIYVSQTMYNVIPTSFLTSDDIKFIIDDLSDDVIGYSYGDKQISTANEFFN